MMKILRIIPLFCLLILGISNLQAQEKEKINIQVNKIEGYINEAYATQNVSIKESRPNVHKGLTELLTKRVYFMKSNRVIEKAAFISSQPLFKKYNQNIQNYTVFNPSSFNPLRYNLPFWSVSATMYRLDGTDYYLIIEGQNFNPKN